MDTSVIETRHTWELAKSEAYVTAAAIASIVADEGCLPTDETIERFRQARFAQAQAWEAYQRAAGR